MNATLNQWNRDISVLAELNTHWQDKLDVKAGFLHLEKGRSVRESEPVVVRPVELADHLESLIENTAEECFKLSASRKECPDFYEKVSDLNRQAKCLTNKIYSLFQSILPTWNEGYVNRYSELHNSARAFSSKVQQFKRKLDKPVLNDRPIRHVEYTERTDLDTIKQRYSKRVPLGDVLAAAKKALELAQPYEKMAYNNSYLQIGNGAVVASPRQGLMESALKLVMAVFAANESSIHMKAFQTYANQLLHTPYITKEFAEAFKELAPHVNALDIRNAVLASKDINELMPFITEDKRPGAIPLSVFLKEAGKLCEQKNIEFYTLKSVNRTYRSWNDLYLDPMSNFHGQSVEQFLDTMTDILKKLGSDANDTEAHAYFPYISPKALEILLDAAASSPNCKKVMISSSLLELPHVNLFFEDHAYRLDEKEVFTITYLK
jgi:hypothetical protein